MASKTTLNAKNLEKLGAQRLAELLIEISKGNAATKRRLRLEIVAAQSPADIGREVRKRLAIIGRSHSFVEWHKMKLLVDDLESQRRAIIDRVAKHDVAEAIELMWRFMSLANSVFERCDDSNGVVIEIFHSACSDLGEIASTADTDPEALADRVFQALNENDYGQFDDLITILAPALGHTGLEHLKQCMIELSKEPVSKPDDNDRKVIGWGSGGPVYADEIAERSRISTVKLALKDIADIQGDVDAFINQYDMQTRQVPRIAAEIAQRLLSAGRAEEALQTLEATKQKRNAWPDFEWEDVRIDVLEELGHPDEAQAARWSCFEKSLSISHLRAYLKRLPDFDDTDAEEKALTYVQEIEGILQALSFLISWPALDRANNLIQSRASELDGDHYEILTPAADALAGKYPLAATLVLRAMINFLLTRGRSSRYRHAARHLLECASLAFAVQDFAAFVTHEAYVNKLKAEHGRKTSFWNLIS